MTPGSFIFRAADNALSEAETAERWVYMSMRMPDSGNLVPIGSAPIDKAEDDLGGGGGRSSPREYIKVLESLLKNDGRLLKPETVDKYVFSPQLADGPDKLGGHLQTELDKYWATLDGGRMLTGGYPLPAAPAASSGPSSGTRPLSPTSPKDDEDRGTYEYNHSLVGALSRKKGSKSGLWSAHWGGLPNLQWWVDRERGVCGLVSMQLIPPGDPLCLDLAKAFREGVVQAFGGKEEGIGRESKL
jgi:hypothetical protein